MAPPVASGRALGRGKVGGSVRRRVGELEAKRGRHPFSRIESRVDGAAGPFRNANVRQPLTTPDAKCNGRMDAVPTQASPPRRSMTAQFPAEVSGALAEASYIYLTTYSPSGKPGTVPTWCWFHEGAVYFMTKRSSLKARRIARDGH